MKGIFLALCALTLVISTARAEEKSARQDFDGQRGGVGLVLSGGGAKGLYHVGLIKALEENDIPIDYVAGASMGAIVGGMYAAGWSPERMWQFFLTDSVSTWLSGKMPGKFEGYYRRFEPRPEMVGIRLNPDSTTNKNVLQLPTNLISPYMIDMALLDIFGPASSAANNHFDSLMVPFRCVATDIFRKEVVVFKDGSLPFAVRTSMTIPLVFKPLKKDSTLLYDGGVLNNFPWQTLDSDFAPSSYIGGVCSDNFDNPSQSDIVGQVMVLMTRPTDYSLPDTARDVIVGKVMPDIGILEYDKAAIVMQRGYDDAMAQMDQIKAKIKRRVPKAEVEARRARFINVVPELVFDSINIEGLTRSQEAYVRRQLGLHLHPVFDYKYFYDKYMRVLASEVFTGEFPEVVYDPQTGFYRINLQMHTKASIRFSLGGNISSSSLNEGYVGFNYRHTTSVSSSYGLDVYFGMFYNALHVGGRHDFYTNFPFYVDYNFRVEGFDYDGSNQTPYYRNKDWRYKTRRTMNFSSSISIPVFKNSAFRGALALGQTEYTYFEQLFTGADKPNKSGFDYLTLSTDVETSTINYPLYGTEGTQQLFSLRYVVGLENYVPSTTSTVPSFSGSNRWWVEFRYRREQYVPITKWFTLGYLADITVSNLPSFGTSLAANLVSPRFEATPQMRTLFMTEFTSPSYVGLGVIPTFNFLKSGAFYLQLYAFAFIPQELIFENNIWHVPALERWDAYCNFIFGGSLVYQTPIGPVSLTLAKYTTGRDNWNFQFNFGYLLFKNRRF